MGQASAPVDREGLRTITVSDLGEFGLIARVTADLALATGQPVSPVDAHVQRWGGALPQYAVGHLDRVARIRAGVDAVPGLEICGAAYDGVGIPAVIGSGHAAATRVVAMLDPAATMGT